MSEKEMFGSKSLKCLVCQKMVEEFEYKVSKVDPNKKISAGSFRINSNGQQNEKVVSKNSFLLNVWDCVRVNPRYPPKLFPVSIKHEWHVCIKAREWRETEIFNIRSTFIIIYVCNGNEIKVAKKYQSKNWITNSDEIEEILYIS